MPCRVLSSLLLLIAAAPALRAQVLEGAGLEVQLRVEERLLAEDLSAYREARVQEQSAIDEVAEATASLDTALASALPRPEELEQIERERTVALAALEVVSGSASELRRRILERLRRTAALRQELLRGGVLAAPADPITGRWRVEISSPRQEGIFELRLTGTVVEGTYAFEGGRSGSLKGTYVAGRINLERIDAERGLDGIFQGTVEAAAGVVRGFWSPTVLSGGSPGGAGWSAVRISPAAAEGNGNEASEEGTER